MPSVTLGGCRSRVSRQVPVAALKGTSVGIGTECCGGNAAAVRWRVMSRSISVSSVVELASFDSNITAYAILSKPPTRRETAHIATANGRTFIAIVNIETIGTTRKVKRKIKRPCLMPFERAETPFVPAVFCGMIPPVFINSAVPVNRNPQREQKLVSVETRSWPQFGQNIENYL